MKRLVAFIGTLLVLGAALFAEVTVKDLGDGTVEVTFFFGSTTAKEVLIAGDFTDWQNGWLPMTKVANGWEFKKVFPRDATIKYKFVADGQWIFDIKAPDKIDDGFGGFNGLVDVAELLAAKSGGTAASSGGGASSAKLKFQTWSMIGLQGKFNTKTQTLESAGIGAKSYAKFSGDALPNLPVYVEVALFENDGFENLYKKDSLEFSKGLTNFLVDTFFDPIHYYNGQKTAGTYLGHFKAGFSSPYVNYLTGYKYAKLPSHTNVSWTTVDQEWEAGYAQVGGFSQFSLGQALQNIGDNITINAVLGPNRTADRAGNQYGLYSYVTAQIGDHYLDFQYNGAYGKTYDTIFDSIYEADFIGGYKGLFGPITIKANALFNVWGSVKINDLYKTAYSPSSSDVSSAKEGLGFLHNFATNLQVTYTAESYGITLGYRARGTQASMMYVEEGADGHTNISDQLGALNTQRVWVDGYVKPIDILTLSLNPYAQMAFIKDDYASLASWQRPYVNKDTLEFYLKPSIDLDTEALLAGIPSNLSLYAKMKYVNTTEDQYSRGTSKSAFLLSEGGAKFTMKDITDIFKAVEVYYGYDNTNTNQLFNTLIGAVTLPQSFTVQAGAGLRTAHEGVTASDAPFGFFLGIVKKVEKVLYKPVAYAQFIYNMDPYKGFGDGQDNFNLDGYILDNGVGAYENYGAFRIGLRWDL